MGEWGWEGDDDVRGLDRMLLMVMWSLTRIAQLGI